MTTTAEVRTDLGSKSQDKVKVDDASQYWGGYLFRRDKTPTDKLDRLLRGIFVSIHKRHPVPECHDLAPAQLASFYRDIGGNYDPLFIDNDPSSIAFIYRSLGCLHSLQPNISEEDSAYATPSIPALKPRGFVRWLTIQLHLTPQEHVHFIQNALRVYDVHDPQTKAPFPRMIPSSCFPTKPDPEMESWHDRVATRLEHDSVDAYERSSGHEHRNQITHHASRPISATPTKDQMTPNSERVDSLRHEHRASSSDNSRPKFVRTISRAAPPMLKEGGKAVAVTVRQIANPFLFSSSQDNNREHTRDSDSRTRSRRRSLDSHDLKDDRQDRPKPRRQSSYSVSASRPRTRRGRSHEAPDRGDSAGSDERPPPRHRPRRHRSHDPSTHEQHDRAWDARPNSQHMSDIGSDSTPTHNHRESAEHERRTESRTVQHSHSRKGRQRARFSVSDGARKQSLDTLSPGQEPPQPQYRHRSSVPHVKVSPNTDGYGNIRSPPPRNADAFRNPSPFKDPFAGEHDVGSRDPRDGRGFRVPPDAASNSSSVSGSSIVSPSNSDAPPPASSRGGSQAAHRYVTPGNVNQVNGVRGRTYPSGDFR